MHTETAILLALVATLFAMMAGVAAAVAWSLVRRWRRSLLMATDRLQSMVPILTDELTAARGSVVGAQVVLSRVRGSGTRLDSTMDAWMASLIEGRTSIERLDAGRLRPAVRAMHIASALARIAMVWRAPAR